MELFGLGEERCDANRCEGSRSCGLWGGLERVQVENEVLNVFIAQASLERRHDAASPGQYGGANHIIGGGSSAGKGRAIEDTMQVRRNLLEVEPPLTVAAAAVHFEQLMSACDSFRPAAFRIGTAGRRR